MSQLCELDLQLAFEAACALRKDVENQPRSIEDSALQERLEIALLAGRQGVIENDEIGLSFANESADLFCFTRSDVEPRVGSFSCAGDDAQYICACGSSEGIELVQLILFWCVPKSDTNKERTFAAAGTFKQY